MNNSIYYNYDKLFSYPFLFAFVIGERGVGKTFNAKVHALNQFINKGDQFIYLRRYKTELDASLQTFWNDLKGNNYFEAHDLQVKKNKMLTTFTCNGEVCGYAIPLSTANILKSTAFPNVKLIIFDEFLLDGMSGTYRYLKNEVTMLLDAVETIARLRDVQVLFLGNAVSITNPYFAYFDLSLPYKSEFKSFKNGTIVVNYIHNQAYREAKRQSRFGQLIDNTAYGRYAIDNEWLRDDKHFILKRPPESRFLAILTVNGINVGIWSDKSGMVYLSTKYDPKTTARFALDFNDHTESTIYLSARENWYLRFVIKAYKQAILRFENQKIKNNVLPLINKCIAFS